MTDKEVLQKAIEMAIENNWRAGFLSDWSILIRSNGAVQFENPGCILEDIESIIFSHDFAKAFWGEESMEDYILRHPNSRGGMTTFKPLGKWMEDKSHYPKEWEVHLQQMVLCSNPIDYLRPFLYNTEPLKNN